MSPRARIIVIAGAAACLAAGGTVALAVITSNGKGGNQNKPVPLAGAPPLALDLGVRTDPEARSLRRAERLYSTQAASRGRTHLRPVPARPRLRSVPRSPPGRARASPRSSDWRRSTRRTRSSCSTSATRTCGPATPRRQPRPGGERRPPSRTPCPPNVRTTSCILRSLPASRCSSRASRRRPGSPGCRLRASSSCSGRTPPGPMPTRSSCTGSRSSGSAAASPPSGSSTTPPGSTPAIRRRRSRPPSAASTRASRRPRSRASARSRSAIRTPPRSGSTSASCCSGWPAAQPGALAEGKRQLRLVRKEQPGSPLAREAKRLLAGLEGV